MVKAIPALMTQSEVAATFSVNGVNIKGKPVMRCSRCEGLPDSSPGKSFQLLPKAITKAKKHVAIYYPEVRPEINSGDANLRHTLLINMSAKHVLSLSKKAQYMRKLRLCKRLKFCMFLLSLSVLYCIVWLYNACISLLR